LPAGGGAGRKRAAWKHARKSRCPVTCPIRHYDISIHLHIHYRTSFEESTHETVHSISTAVESLDSYMSERPDSSCIHLSSAVFYLQEEHDNSINVNGDWHAKCERAVLTASKICACTQTCAWRNIDCDITSLTAPL